MNISELRDIIALLQSSDINVLELKRPDSRLRLEMPARTAAVAQAATPRIEKPAAPASTAIQIPAPGFGIFTTRHPARDAAFCRDGQHVNVGDTLALLRIDELYVPVISHASGQVRQLVDEGSLTGYATPLFEITP